MDSRFKDNWFHGTAGRVEVEDLVKNARLNGSFAVRCSESIAGAFSISLLRDGRVYTYRVLPTPDGKLGVQTNDGVQKRKFTCIDDLVLEYKVPGNGLVCGLTNPVPSPRITRYARQQPYAPGMAPAPTTILLSTYPSAPPELPPRPVRIPHSQAPPAPVAESPQQSCTICMDARVNAFLQPCGHVCMCMDCAKQVNDCPLCRKKISKIQKAFLS